MDRDQTLGFELPKRVTDRHSADPEPGGQIVLT
jgi:hypothetical protein